MLLIKQAELKSTILNKIAGYRIPKERLDSYLTQLKTQADAKSNDLNATQQDLETQLLSIFHPFYHDIVNIVRAFINQNKKKYGTHKPAKIAQLAIESLLLTNNSSDKQENIVTQTISENEDMFEDILSEMHRIYGKRIAFSLRDFLYQNAYQDICQSLRDFIEKGYAVLLENSIDTVETTTDLINQEFSILKDLIFKKELRQEPIDIIRGFASEIEQNIKQTLQLAGKALYCNHEVLLSTFHEKIRGYQALQQDIKNYSQFSYVTILPEDKKDKRERLTRSLAFTPISSSSRSR